MNKLNIGFWNAHGLNNNKIEDVDFISYVNSFEIVGFVEILVTESPGNLPDFSPTFTVKTVPRKRRGDHQEALHFTVNHILEKGYK